MEELEQKIREKNASANDYFDYLTAVSEAGDKLKYAQVCCCFFDYCIKNDDIPSYVAYSSKIETSPFIFSFMTNTSLDKQLYERMHEEQDIDFPMEAILNDFEEKKDILDLCSIGYDSNKPNEFPKPSVLSQRKKPNKFLVKLKAFAKGLNLGLTIFGKILFGLFAALTIVALFVKWECALILIPVIIRLFTKTEMGYNKASVWIVSFVAPLLVMFANDNLTKLSLLMLVPIVCLVLALIKGFTLNKYLAYNTIGFNVILIYGGSGLVIPSICVAVFVLIHCFANEKWEQDWVIDGLSAAAMAGNADTVIVNESYKRKLRLYYAAEHMDPEQKKELIYLPSCFYTMPEKESLGNSKSFLMSFLLLIVVIVSGIYVWRASSNPSTNNQPAMTTYESTSNNPSCESQEDYPFTAQRLITESELTSYSKEELSIMRNEIFARHGYIFKRADLKEYFSQKTWYNPQYTNVDKYLTAIERQNVAVIQKVEKKRK